MRFHSLTFSMILSVWLFISIQVLHVSGQEMVDTKGSTRRIGRDILPRHKAYLDKAMKRNENGGGSSSSSRNNDDNNNKASIDTTLVHHHLPLNGHQRTSDIGNLSNPSGFLLTPWEFNFKRVQGCFFELTAKPVADVYVQSVDVWAYKGGTLLLFTRTSSPSYFNQGYTINRQDENWIPLDLGSTAELAGEDEIERVVLQEPFLLRAGETRVIHMFYASTEGGGSLEASLHPRFVNQRTGENEELGLHVGLPSGELEPMTGLVSNEFLTMSVNLAVSELFGAIDDVRDMNGLKIDFIMSTSSPTLQPTIETSTVPTLVPSVTPTFVPTTAEPTMDMSSSLPTVQPISFEPTRDVSESLQPTHQPLSLEPTPGEMISTLPTVRPLEPSSIPTIQPTTFSIEPTPLEPFTSIPTISSDTSEPTSLPTRTTTTTFEPTPLPDTTEPTSQPISTAPTTRPITAEPTPLAATSEPTDQPISTTAPSIRPISSEPTVQPISTEPTPFPLTSEPTVRPITIEPTPFPITIEPTDIPATAIPTMRPISSEPTIQPITIEPTPFPITAEPTLFPVSSEPTGQPVSMTPTVQQTTAEPTPRPVTSQPTTQPTTSEPTAPPIIDITPEALCPEIDRNNYNICLDAVSTGTYVNGDWRVGLAMAKARWEQVITRNLSRQDAPSNRDMTGPLLPDEIDDLYIYATDPFLDGSGADGFNLIGFAAPRFVRQNNLPYTGFMEFDSFDIDRLIGRGKWYTLALHEIGHILGIGILWRRQGLVTGSGSNIRYIGENGCRYWEEITGCTGTCPPIETELGEGTAEIHWNEAGMDGLAMDHELMTGLNEGVGVFEPLSKITIGTLQDIGYRCNIDAADEWVTHPTCRRRQRRLLRSDGDVHDSSSASSNTTRYRLDWGLGSLVDSHGVRHLPFMGSNSTNDNSHRRDQRQEQSSSSSQYHRKLSKKGTGLAKSKGLEILKNCHRQQSQQTDLQSKETSSASSTTVTKTSKGKKYGTLDMRVWHRPDIQQPQRKKNDAEIEKVIDIEGGKRNKNDDVDDDENTTFCKQMIVQVIAEEYGEMFSVLVNRDECIENDYGCRIDNDCCSNHCNKFDNTCTTTNEEDEE